MTVCKSKKRKEKRMKERKKEREKKKEKKRERERERKKKVTHMNTCTSQHHTIALYVRIYMYIVYYMTLVVMEIDFSLQEKLSQEMKDVSLPHLPSFLEVNFISCTRPFLMKQS